VHDRESTFAKATADKTEQGERVVTGVVADAVNQVIEFSPDDIEPPPAFGTGVRLHYLDGTPRRARRSCWS
jgi:purine-binding chemotaxis protein CheW